MVKILCTKREIELLDLSYKTMKLSPNYTVVDNAIIIFENEKDNLFEMFNCILDTFLKIGLMDNDEPNDIGLELETLNTKINHEYILANEKCK